MIEWNQNRFTASHLPILQLFEYGYVAVEGAGLIDFSSSLHATDDIKEVEAVIASKAGRRNHHFDVFLSKKLLPF
jgi:hypothetical protein